MIKKQWWLMLVVGGLLLSCNTRPPSIFHEGSHIFGLASPIRLDGDSTLVFLTDYFLKDSIDKIDSVSGVPELQFLLAADKASVVLIKQSQAVPFISEMLVWIGADSYSFFVERSQKQRHQFVFDPNGQRFNTVGLRGDMTNWAEMPLSLIDGKWQALLHLNPGSYHYQLVVNGRSITDPNNPITIDNNAGGFNSVLSVPGFDRKLTPHLYTLSHSKFNINLGFNNQADQILAFWDNFRLPDKNIFRHGNHLQVLIPGDAIKKQRSYLRIRAYNQYGPANDLLIPLQNGHPVTDAALLTRQDKEQTILYFMMVDRFKNGNPGNDDPIIDPEVAPRANFFGGDLDGITQKIEDGYFANLGINTIWLSPVSQNPLEAYREFPSPHRKYTGYHGYWPTTLTTVDHRFGNEQAMRRLVETAHQNNISVMLDFVSNHVHKKNPLIVKNPHWATTLNLPDGRKNIRIWEDHRLTTWFDVFLPSLDFSNPEVISTMVDSAFFWIREYGLDGFRHDATKHIPQEFWRALIQKLKEEYMVPEGKRLFQIGETFGNRELIGSYLGSGLLDGQFDFNLYFDARSAFAIDQVPFSMLNFSIHQTFNQYGFINMMGNITGNHDMARFISLAGGGLSFAENHIEAGWAREVVVGDPVGYQKLASLTAFIMTIPGIPVIYYGDEIGMPGGGDPDSRRPMKFENLSEHEKSLKEKTTALTKLRSNNLAFIFGDFTTLLADDHAFAYARTYFGQNAIVVFNKSREPKTITLNLAPRLTMPALKANFGAGFSLNANTLTIDLGPNSFEILTTQ